MAKNLFYFPWFDIKTYLVRVIFLWRAFELVRHNFIITQQQQQQQQQQLITLQF